MIIRLIWSYTILKSLHKSLSHTSLSNIKSFSSYNRSDVKIAYNDHPLVPFTFGWKEPIIVLPYSIKDDPEKVRMAIQHELVHIQRGDYLLQLLLSVIESIFWFHPLIHFGSREIETYREISCDQEVLNTSGISIKSYASMLYELVPLQRGLGSFSVSMAVQNSTLKQRIETMKYHKMYKSSLKRSLLFLILMITAVTIPIACSDMRGPQGLSPEELEQEMITLSGLNMEINSVQIWDLPTTRTTQTSGLGSVAVSGKDYGMFIIALSQFPEAVPAGEISGNTIKFKVNELTVKMTNGSNYLSKNESAEIWVKHIPDVKSKTVQMVFANAQTNYESYYEKEQKDFEDNGDYFVVVEEPPKLIGGLTGLQSKVQYPTMARRAGIEGRVTVQFIVNENGDVENPKVIRGIGGGCDEAALEAVKQAKFSPGMQRGRAVRVQYSLPIVFRLSNADFSSNKDLVVTLLSKSNNSIKFKVTNTEMAPLAGANVSVSGTNIGAASDQNGIVTITQIEPGRHEFVVSYVGLNTAKVYHTINTN